MKGTSYMSENLRGLLYAEFQEKNPLKFNEELIYYKENEDITEYADSIGKGLEILPGIKYNGSRKQSLRKVYQYSEEEKDIDIEKSMLQTIVMDFHLSRGEEETEDYEERDIKLSFFFPVLIDRQFFILNGVTYVPMYQLLNSGTYRTRKYLVLRNQVMPLHMGDSFIEMEDINGKNYRSKTLTLFMFTEITNMFLYYFAKMGFTKTLEFFGLDDYFVLIDLENGEEFYEEEGIINFKISNNVGISLSEDLLKDESERIIVFTLLSNLSPRIKTEKILDDDYWVKQLGSNFTKNNSMHYEKGMSILISFERCLDSITKMILRIPENDKKDVYTIVRYMARNYNALSKLDNMNLANKRLRLYEQLICPLQTKLSNGVYRLLNKKNPTLDEMESIFKMPEGYLIKSLIDDTLRYVNNVNSYDLFANILKGTMGGPQSIFASKKSDNIRQRAIHPSYFGRIDLLASSAGDPGVSFELVPFLHLYDNLHFTEEFNIEMKEEDLYNREKIVEELDKNDIDIEYDRDSIDD